MKYRDPSTGQFKDLTVKVSDTLPIGVQMPYGGTTPPTGWLICDGSAVSRTTYADLFAVIGISYGAGNGTTTFNLPNKKGRNSVGLDSTDTDFNTIGKTGGEKTHTLTIEEIPSHTHDVRILGDSNGGGTVSDNYQLQIGSYEHRQRLSTYTTGGGQAHNILQPYEVDNWIIKAWQPIAVPGIVTNDMTSESTKDVPSVKAVKDYVSVNIIPGGAPVKTGRKVNGKDEFIKRIDFGYLPDTTYKDVNIGIEEDILIDHFEGTGYSDTGNIITIPYSAGGEYWVMLNYQATSKTIRIQCGTDRSSTVGIIDVYFTYVDNV